MDARLVPVAKRPLILLVEDDVRTARTLAQMLREDGYDVDFAADGAAAVSRLARDPLPDVLVTDVTMPYVDGIAVTRYARSRKASLPVFVVTGHPHLFTAGERLEPQPTVFTKPVAYADLVRHLRDALEGLEQ